VQPLRGAADVLLLGDRDEIVELADIQHARPLRT
jgi:hypothetical protein